MTGNSIEGSIRTSGLVKTFRVYGRPIDRVKEALLLGRRKYHTDFRALDGIDLEVQPGETVGLIGQNGSGKSTLLKILARLMIPTQGEVQVNGRVASIIELGTGFHPEFTGRANVYMTGSLLGFEKRELDEMFPAIHEFSGLGEFIDRPVKTYSSGMWVRLAFSTAISVDPQILLIDEALTVGDMYFQQKCMRRLREFQASKTSIVFVSHDLEAVKTLCARTLLLHKGVRVSEGLPDAVCSEYISLVASQTGRTQLTTREGGRYRRYGSFDVEIESVQLVSLKGEPLDVLVSGDRAVVKVNIRKHREVEELAVGILIRDRLGNDVYGTNTHLAGVEIPLGGSRYTIAFEVPFNLGPRHYYVGAAVHTGRDHLTNCFDWIDQAVAFQVLSGDEEFAGVARLFPQITVQDPNGKILGSNT